MIFASANAVESVFERLEAQDLLCSRVKTLDEALKDPQTIHNGMVIEVRYDGVGPMKLVGSPVHLSETPLRIRHAPPRLGEHGTAILEELGYDADKIARLREGGVVA